MPRTVLISDYAWRDLEIEKAILVRAGATLLVAETGAEDELTALAPEADGILTCWKPLTSKVIQAACGCLAIGRYGIGLDNIDVAAATRLGIIVTNVPAYCVEEVSDHALAMLLSLARKVTFYDRAIKSGLYDLQRETPLFRVRGRVLGIVGFGKIGRVLYRKAYGLGLKIIVHDPYVDRASVSGLDVEIVDFRSLLQRSDFISLHLPLTPETRGLFNRNALRQMKSGAFLINTSRGHLIDAVALRDALDQGIIAGAGLDVLPAEPPDADDPLIGHPRTIITPHVAFNSEESLIELRETAARQMAAVLWGRRPESIVNPEVLKQSNLRAVFNSNSGI
jgi:D-3-phosphoglycerate dehydrogenase / 2-oxoglutarate reductase